MTVLLSGEQGLRTPPSAPLTGAGGALAPALALMGCFLVGANIDIAMRVTTATLASVALLPVWVGTVTRFRHATTVLLLAGVALVSGVLMAVYAPEWRSINWAEARGNVSLLLTAAMSLGLLLWARTVVPLHRLVLVYGIGALLAQVPASAGSPNAWKYHLAIPITLVVLSLVGATRSIPVWIAALLGLGAVGVVFDHRSYFGLCLLACLVLLWHTRTRGLSRRSTRIRGVAFLILGTYGLYVLATSLMIAGYLGEAYQERSLAQAQAGGSVILGGRPEWAASVALLMAFPGGFGIGAVPRLAETMVAREGLAMVGISGHHGYVDSFMFGGRFELHSVMADYWAWFGLAGLVLGAVIGVLVVWGLTRPSDEVAARPTTVFISLMALWLLAFGPAFTSQSDIILALALTLPLAGGARMATGHSGRGVP